MSRLATRLVAVLAPVVLLPPAAAHAEQVSVDDAVSDVKALNFASDLAGLLFGTGGDDAGPPFLDAPAETATDITRTTIQHARRVSITVHFLDLVETAEYSVTVGVRTPDEMFDVFASRAADGSQYATLFPSVIDESVPGRPRPCRSVRGRYDVVAETVTVSFPAACVGKPRWIQAEVGAARFQVTPLGDGSVNLAGWADDAFRSGLSENSRGWSPKVRRG
ncbi:hypothetical protein AAII07_03105 [Microvirga sp. 0TCS3.31]